MSQWTHVAGLIRLDGIEFLDKDIKKHAESNFGKCVSYDDPEEDWDNCNVPCGSEGSVQYKVVKTADSDSMMAWGVVYIWGDLRDFQDVNKIYEWIKNSCKGLFVRSCCVKIDVEYHNSYVVYDHTNEDYSTEILMKELQ